MSFETYFRISTRGWNKTGRTFRDRGGGRWPSTPPHGRAVRAGIGSSKLVSPGMSFDLDDIGQRLARLDERLRPIAKGIVDLSDPAWVEKFRKGPKPLDRAGVRAEAEALLELLLASYRTGSPTVRTSIRSLFALNSSFTWATPVRPPLTTEQGFRQALLKISAVDRAQDMRDTILHLNEISAKAEAAGVNTGPIFDEVAALSSDESAGQMGSMRSIFLRARYRYSGTL